MKAKYWWMTAVLLTQALPGIGQAQETTPTPAITAVSMEQEKLDVERLQLENEKLKLEIEKMKLSATAVPPPSDTPTAGPVSALNKEDLLDFKQSYSDKSMALSKAHAGESDLMVLDFVNAELWYKGARYSLYEIPTVAEDQKLKMNKTLDERMAIGTPRWRYQAANAGLLKYESRDRGIFEITAPQGAGDFKVLTPDGISFDSTMADIRNSVENLYFKYDGAGESGSLRILRYNHDDDLSFSDKLEFWVARDGSIKKIRFGTLDEK